jgi:hypothetical protein
MTLRCSKDARTPGSRSLASESGRENTFSPHSYNAHAKTDSKQSTQHKAHFGQTFTILKASSALLQVPSNS